jgi:hypothetical protein
MANHLAMATVTEALRQRLERAARKVVPGANVDTQRPDGAAPQPRSAVTLFLYRVTPNAALRNADLPTRTADGTTLRQRPRAALDLHYLLSFAGDDAEFVPQRLLGVTVGELHARPILTRDDITQAIAGNPLLGASTLHLDTERVKLTLASLTLDELSKLWSVFFQAPYLLSVAFEASVVLVEADLPVNEPLRVQQRSVGATELRLPLIEHVRDRGQVDNQVFGLADLEIAGQRLRGARTLVRFDDGDPVLGTPEGDTRVIVPAATVLALGPGVHGLQIIHEALLGDPPLPHRVIESNVVPFVLRPRIMGDPQVVGPDLVVTIAPPVVPDRARLQLSEYLAEAPTDRVPRFASLTPRDAGAAPLATLHFPLAGVSAGTYLVRVQANGAESLPAFAPDPADPTRRQPTPLVTLP